jgi:ATP-dependent helicase/nuclease subunit B
MKLLTGPANSGKTERIFARLGEAIAEDRGRVFLIVPSSQASEVMSARLYDYLHRRGVQAKSQIIRTFPGLYKDILTATGRASTTVAAIARARVLRRCISYLAETDSLEYFGPTSHTEGIVPALAGFIDELWRSGVSPDEFAQFAEARTAKDRDIARVFSTYNSELTGLGLLDVEGAGRAAIEALAGAGGLAYSLVAADGFSYYTPVQVNLLSRLDSFGVETVAALTFQDGRAVHLWQEPTRARFATAGAEVINSASKADGIIDRAASALMNDEQISSPDSLPNPSAASHAITVVSAPDRGAEVRAVLREVKKLVSKYGYRRDEIMFVCRSLAPYLHHFERVSAEYLLPIAIDCAFALGDNPLVVSTLRLLKLGIDSYPRRPTIDCLRSPYFDLTAFGLTDAAISTIERTSLSGNVTRGVEQWTEAITGAGERARARGLDYDEQEDDTAITRRERYAEIASKLKDFFDTVTFARDAARFAHSGKILSVIDSLKIDGCLEDGDDREGDRRALEKFRELVRAIGVEPGPPDQTSRGASPSGVIEWSSFYEELEQAVAACVYDRPRQAQGAVIAQELHNLRPRRYRSVFVLGLVEGELPVRLTERSPYTMIEREEIRRCGIDLAETAADAGADLTQFYKAISSATERLYLSWARTDLAGGELLRSYLIDEILAAAPACEVRIPQNPTRAERMSPHNIGSLQELAVATAYCLRQSTDGEDNDTSRLQDELREATALLGSNLKSWPMTLRGAAVEWGRMRGRSEPGFAGLIEDEELLARLEKLIGPTCVWSVSQLNDYGTCPFRFFARQVLRLTDAAEPVEGFAADRLGNAYHRILEKLHARLQVEGKPLSLESLDVATELAATISEGELEEMVAAGELRRGALWEFEKEQIRRNVVALLHKEIEWSGESAARPVAFEQKFGLGGWPALQVQSEGGSIKLCGIIDRIDEGEDGLVVIDYKTSKTPIRHNDALDGRNLQLPIYLMAAARVVRPGGRVSSAYYLHINSRKKGSPLPHRDDSRLTLDGIIAQAEDYIRRYVGDAQAGLFPVRPNKGRCPNQCEIEPLCRIHTLGPQSHGDADN